MKPFLLALLTLSALAARAQEVTLIAPGGIRAAVEDLIPGFEKKTGIKVKATFGSGLGTKKQIAAGEVFDVPILQPPYPEVLSSGNVIATSAKPLASVAVGLAVKTGARKPDISSADAVKKTLMSAKSVAYPNPAGGAAAGVSFDAALKMLGIATQMEPRLKRAQGGAGAMLMTAKGEAELGVTFVSEMNEPGVEIVGPFPETVSTPTALVGFVHTHAKNADAARKLLEYLASPEAAKAYRAHGMQAGK